MWCSVWRNSGSLVSCGLGKLGKRATTVASVKLVKSQHALPWSKLYARFKGNKIPLNAVCMTIHNLDRHTYKAKSCKCLRICLLHSLRKVPFEVSASVVIRVRKCFVESGLIFLIILLQKCLGHFKFVHAAGFSAAAWLVTHTWIPQSPAPSHPSWEVVSSPIGVNPSCAGVSTYVAEKHAEMSWLCKTWLAAIEAIIAPIYTFLSLSHQDFKGRYRKDLLVSVLEDRSWKSIL